MTYKNLLILFISIFLPLPLWADGQDLKSLMEASYTNAEATLLELARTTPEALPVQARRWYYLNKALTEAQLQLFEDMNLSLNSVEPLFAGSAEESKDQNYQEAKATFFLLRARHANNNSSYNQAINYSETTRTLSTAQNLNAIYVLATSELANAYVNITDYERALTLNYQAYSQAVTLNNPYVVAYVNQMYGNIYHDIGAYDDSIQYFTTAKQGYQELGYSEFVSVSLFGIASAHRYQKKYDLAVKIFQQYKDRVKSLSFEKSHYMAFYGLGMTLAEKPDCQEALPNLQRAIEIGGPKDWDLELLKRKTYCNILVGNIVEAENAFAQAKMMLIELPDLHGTGWAVELIQIESTIERAKNNFQVAYELLRQYNLEMLTINQKHYSDRLTDIRLTLGVQKKDIEIQLLQERSHYQERQTSLYLYAAYTGIILLSILIFLLVMYYRKSKKFHLLSIRDSMTGIYNRRYIFTQLEKIYAEKIHERSTFSVLCLDIDNFKIINDTYGHTAGDNVIKHIAKMSTKTLRMTDILGRVGGEEFMAILPRTEPVQAERIAQRLLSRIESTSTTLTDGSTIKATISIGLSHSNQKITTAQAIYHEADTALYESKHKGKNCLSIAQSA